MKKVLIILLGTAWLMGCTQKSKQVPADTPLEEVVADSASVGEAFDSLVVSESRALVDTTYRNSDEYKKAHEEYEVLTNKLTQGLDDVDAHLLLLKNAIASFLHYSAYFATHTSEMGDEVNRKRMMLYGQKVREVRQKLIQSKLSEQQQAQLDSLNGLIHF